MSRGVPLDASGVPEYLETTHELVARLNRGDDPAAAVVSAIATLEKLIRIPPAKGTVADGFIDTGELEARLPDLPVTQRIVRAMERTAGADGPSDHGVYALAALQRSGLIVNLSAAFEELIQDLDGRLGDLEEGDS